MRWACGCARGRAQAFFERRETAASEREPEIEPIGPGGALQEAAAPLTVEEERLLGLLKGERRRLARARRLPPRKIASDEALRAFACRAADARLEGIEDADAKNFARIAEAARRRAH